MSGWTAWRFADPLLLAGVVLLAVVAYAEVTGSGQRRIAFPTLAIVRKARGGRHRSLRYIPVLLRLGAIFLIVVALARPQGGNITREVTSEGVDIILAVDTSGSMQAMDFTLDGERVNRLEAAKSKVRQFIEGRENDRIGLVVFGEEALIQCPNTVDYGVIGQTLDAVQIGMAGDGTAIGSAIGTAVQSLKELPGRSRILILLTDGENTTGILDPVKAARAAATYGIKVYTIGVGTEGKAPFEVNGLFGKQYVYQEVHLDEMTLKAIAEATGARYFRATSSEALANVYKLIDELEKTEVKVKEFTDYHELFRVPLWLAMCLLLLELVLRATWLRTLP